MLRRWKWWQVVVLVVVTKKIKIKCGLILCFWPPSNLRGRDTTASKNESVRHGSRSSRCTTGWRDERKKEKAVVNQNGVVFIVKTPPQKREKCVRCGSLFLDRRKRVAFTDTSCTARDFGALFVLQGVNNGHAENTTVVDE